MRYFFIVFLLLLSFAGYSQNRFPSVDSAKNYVLRYVKNSAVETFTNWRAQNVAYGTLELLDSLIAANEPGVDSIWKENDTLKYSKNGITYAVSYLGDDTATVVKAYVTNAEAVTITKGQVVYIYGASGDRASVRLAKNTSDTFSSKTLGIVRADIAAGQAGWITTQGQVSGINLGAYSSGDILWLDSVAGGFTKTKPVAPYHSVFIGVVERANAGNGLIYVKPQNGQELGELHDVKLTTPTNKQILAYTASTDIWENKTIDSSYFGGTFAQQVQNSQTSGIQLQGKDTLLSYNLARNGKHLNGDFDYITTTNFLGGTGDAVMFDAIASGTGGANSEINTSGINSIRNTVAGSGSVSGVIYGYTSVLRVFSFASSTDPSVVNFRIRANDLYDATDRFYFQIGLIDATATNIANGYYFTYDKGQSQTGAAASDNWQCVTANASTRTWTTTSTAVAEDTWLTLSIRVLTGKVIFYVNGSAVAEHSTNITTANTGMLARIVKTAGSNSRSMDCDYITFDQWYQTLR